MASPTMLPSPEMSFSEFPEDVQINILSFLSPVEISAFACTSRRFASLCGASASGSLPLWFAMCHRRWGSKTSLGSWIPSAADSGEGGAAASSGSSCHQGSLFALLYKTLDRWEDLIGFWRRIGHGAPGTPTLILFEWGPSYITASRVSSSPPSSDDGYDVLKIPFLWLGLSPHGEPVSFLHPTDGSESPNVAGELVGSTSTSELVPVTVSFMGCNHFVVEVNRGFYNDALGYGSSEDLMAIESTSPPDRLMSEIYQYLANRTSPSREKSLRRQRKKERGRFGKQRLPLWEAEHFVKIVNSCPTPERPLQGLWKGISDDMVLEFYLVAYDDVGGITCRRVGEAGEQFSGYSPVFWTSNTTFIEPPFPREEGDLYVVRDHIHPVALSWTTLTSQVVSHILCINSSYDLVIPGSSGDPRNVEGRIWEYDDGTFGFGFLRNNYIIDLKRISLNGSLLDTVEYFCNNSSL